jgi:amino acid transporter
LLLLLSGLFFSFFLLHSISIILSITNQKFIINNNSNFGQYNAAMAPLARVIWAMAKGKTGGKKYLPSLLALSHRRHTGTIRPVGAVVFTGLVSLIISGLPFNVLVQIFLVVR